MRPRSGAVASCMSARADCWSARQNSCSGHHEVSSHYSQQSHISPNTRLIFSAYRPVQGIGQGFYYECAPGLSATLADGSTTTLDAGRQGNFGLTEDSIEVVHQSVIRPTRLS